MIAIPALPPTTIHTRRTLMFEELRQLLDVLAASPSATAGQVLAENGLGKRTKVNQDKTTQLLRQLYVLDDAYVPFRALRFFWQRASDTDQRLLALLFAIGREPLLAESAETVLQTPEGAPLLTSALEAQLERNHPGRYIASTRHSVAMRLVSSWKQAGYRTDAANGRRRQPEVGYLPVAFALLLGWLHGERGEYLLRSRWVSVLALPGAQLRERLAEAAQRGLLQFQLSGEVTIVSFTPLWPQLGLTPDALEG